MSVKKIGKFNFTLLFLVVVMETGICLPVVNQDGANKVSDAIYKETYHFHFQDVDSLIKANEVFYQNSLEFNLAAVNYYWWRLISGQQNEEYSGRVAKRIEKLKNKYPHTENSQSELQFLQVSIYAYSARVSLLDYSYYAALSDLSKYYSLLKTTFGKEETYQPFLLTSGLYYFFAGYARQKMPFLSPVLYYYQPGNMDKGLQYLKSAAISDNWKVNQEAKYFLMKINFDIYKNYSEAGKYCNQLLSMYPENLLFQFYMFRISLALDQVQYAKNRLIIMERTARDNNQLTQDERGFYIKQAEAEMGSYSKMKKGS